MGAFHVDNETTTSELVRQLLDSVDLAADAAEALDQEAEINALAYAVRVAVDLLDYASLGGKIPENPELSALARESGLGVSDGTPA